MADNRPRQESTLPPADGSLHSWKEIAVHLRRDVRTVQRWEKHEGLPVHRHWHRQLGSVYAHKAELDAWWNNHHAASELPESPATPALTPLAAEPPEPAKKSFRVGRRRLLLVGTTFGLAAALAGIVWVRSKPAKLTGGLAVPLAPTRVLATIERPELGASQMWDLAIADVNGDGREDIVAGVSGTDELGIVLAPKLAPHLNLSRDASVLLREEHGHVLRLLGLADINGDGIKDLIVAERLGEPAQFTATGHVFVLFGRRQWKPKMNLPTDADLRIVNTLTYQATVNHAASAKTADWNGDGMDDLILVAADYIPADRASAGAVFVFWGRRQWPATLDLSAADVTIWGAHKGEGLERAAVGDINNDGKNDLVVAASDATLWGLRQQQGRVYAFFGRDRFPRRLDAATDYDVRIEGAEPRDMFSQLSLGDINGDGVEDVIVGAPGAGEAKTGRVFVYYGRRKWERELAPSAADWELTGSEPAAWFGQAVLARDLNQDGADDLVVCTTHSRRNPILIFYGDLRRSGRTSADAADFTVRTSDPEQWACSWAALDAGDLDGNQTPEILAAVAGPLAPGKPKPSKAHVFAPYRLIQIDIRPGYYPNPLWPGSQRVAVVAILARDGFDPKNLDLSTVRFAGAQPMSNRVAPSGTSDPPALYVYFDSRHLRLKPTDRTAALTGKTKDGTPVFGVDSVLVLSDPASKP